ncbi:MAG: FAD-dependent oxidoreductase [Silvibacterium sp.]|nr:FAD-dependent oxidoreductase [Silvibacterium sp.]
MKRTEVAIAGGGIIGLSAALELADAGLRVTIFDRGRGMAEASSAAAGMLAASDPENPAALRPLAELSARLYPKFLERIEELSGERVPIRTRRVIQGMLELPEDFQELTEAELETAAPGIVTEELRFFSLDEESLDPRDLAAALPKAARAMGITLLEDTEITEVRERGGEIEIDTSAGRWVAEKFIHASGAWAARLSGLPITPRKGQMVMVEEQGPALARVVLRSPGVYLVPRGDGRVVIGATVEDAGFDKQVEQKAIAGLLDKAAALWPPVRESRMVESWAGLRPATPDGLPVIDACGERCWFAGGHFRNGILLAPGTARLLREMILGEPLSIDVSDFGCGRFAAAAARGS